MSCTHVHWKGGSLTYDDNDNHKNDDYQDDPELDVLPPQLSLQPRGCALKHVSILVEVVCEKGGERKESSHTCTCTTAVTHTCTWTVKTSAPAECKSYDFHTGTMSYSQKI